MSKGFFNVPIATCEAVKSYAAGTPERKEVLEEYKKMYSSHIDIPCLLYTSPSPRDRSLSRMPSSA